MKTSFKICPKTIYRNDLEDEEGTILHYEELGGLHGFFTVHCIQILEVRGKLVTIKSAQHHNGSLETSRQTRFGERSHV